MILVKNLVEMFNGVIKVKDRVPGDFRKGTIFTVKLPAAGP
jgi:signal transduction histidine kinase